MKGEGGESGLLRETPAPQIQKGHRTCWPPNPLDLPPQKWIPLIKSNLPNTNLLSSQVQGRAAGRESIFGKRKHRSHCFNPLFIPRRTWRGRGSELPVVRARPALDSGPRATLRGLSAGQNPTPSPATRSFRCGPGGAGSAHASLGNWDRPE